MAELVIPPPAWRPSNREYHRTVSHWSSSMVKAFRESPALAQGMFVTKRFERPKPGREMVVGSAVNVLLLEPERAGAYIHVSDVQGRTSKEYKTDWKRRPHQLVVTLSEWEEAQQVADSVLRPRTRAAEVARELLTNRDGYSEYAHQWLDATGVPCKLMVDRLRLVRGGPLVVELKTTFDPRPRQFAKQFYGDDAAYDLQAAFNQRGLRDLLGTTPRYLVVAIRNDVPYQVAVYDLPQEDLDEAAERVETNLLDLKKALDTGVWEAPFESLDDDLLPPLRRPQWARNTSLKGEFFS